MANSCWKCQKEVDAVIHFKTTCSHCFSYLHCCRGCQFYIPGKPNDCYIPGTDPIRDREENNYCEEFKPLNQKKGKSGPSIEDVSKRLFGD
ncbi:MAG: hypothetical protein S4CHLAM7_10240 [Chlamydiae bacterium]|nr:hypothetical protein [Chlamydiota bacterium]